MLLDKYGRSAALLKPLLFIVASELALNQDGRLSHLLIECKLLVLPITTLDHSCSHLLLLLQPPALRKENEVKSQHLTAHLTDSGPTPSSRSPLLKKNVFFHIYLFVCVYGHGCVWTSEDSLRESALFHYEFQGQN